MPDLPDFTLQGGFSQLVSNDVKAGRVKVQYKAFETATRDPATFQTQQVAALAAGKQNRFWNFMELFYHQQGSEGTNYVTENYLDALAAQIPGLNIAQWKTARNDPRAGHPGPDRVHPGEERRGQRHADAAVPGAQGQPGGAVGRPHLQRPREGDQVSLMTTAVSSVTRRSMGLDRRLQIAILVLCILGICDAGYLTYIHYAGLKPICNLGGGCEKVQSSQYSKLDGIPVALLGLIGYIAMLIALPLRTELARAAGFGIALIGFGFSMYLDLSRAVHDPRDLPVVRGQRRDHDGAGSADRVALPARPRRSVIVLAHLGHWYVQLAFAAPALLIIGFMTRDSRRRGGSRKRRDDQEPPKQGRRRPPR